MKEREMFGPLGLVIQKEKELIECIFQFCMNLFGLKFFYHLNLG